MEFRLAIEGRLTEHLEAEANKIGVAVNQATQEAANVVKRDWRRAVMSAGLGQKVANTIRADVYPKRIKFAGPKGRRNANSRITLSPATLVYSKAPHILTGHAGSNISANDGKYMAIPTQFTPLSRAGGRGNRRPMTIEEFLQTFGSKSLARIPLESGRVGLIARKGFGVSRAKKRTRGLGRRITSKSRRGEKALLMYVLVLRVTLPARLNLQGMYDRAERHWPKIVQAALRRVLDAQKSREVGSPISGFGSVAGPQKVVSLGSVGSFAKAA